MSTDRQVLRDVQHHLTSVETPCVECGSPCRGHLTDGGLACEDCCDCPQCSDDPDAEMFARWRAFFDRIGGGS